MKFPISGLMVVFAIIFTMPTLAQVAIGSDEDHRNDFLALVGEKERPYLNYKTLSDSDWDGPETLKIYGPELFSSYNSYEPYGQNDGALWQGKGLNASLTGGARFASHGLEITFKPQLTYSQNQAFKLMASEYPSKYGYIWAYSYGAGVDAPQRFGNEALYGYSWGDSEIRYTWRTLTAGFGTQSPWLGPGRINAIMHSNNASPYPKADLGLRRTPVTLFGRYLGDVEARVWAGYLSESAYFDDDKGNDHNLIAGLAVAYAPSLLPGLTLFANRSYLAPWEAKSAGAVPRLFITNFWGVGNEDTWDQRASLGFSYLLPKAGMEVYGEVGVNDYAKNISGYLRYPFHTMVYTGGFRKSVDLPGLDQYRGELTFEWSNLEVSQNYQFSGPESFYMHDQIKQGYTNEGQWLGAGNGTGGNSQYLGFRVYHERGSAEVYVHRSNPDNDYLYRMTMPNYPTFDSSRGSDFKVVVAVGARTTVDITQDFSVSGGAAYIYAQNPTYFAPHKPKTDETGGFRLEAGFSWRYK